MRRSGVRILVLVVGVVGLGGSGGARLAYAKPSAAAQRRLTAYTSLVRHTRFANAELPAGVKLLPFDEAVKAIADDARAHPDDVDAKLVHRRAIIEVARYAPPAERAKALEVLGAPPAVRALAGDPVAERGMAAAGTADLSAAMASAVPGCATELVQDTVHLDQGASKPAVQVTSEMVVTGPTLDTLSADLDPQNWDGCSVFFCPNGTFLTTADPAAPAACTSAPGSEPVPLPSPPAAGTDWGPAVLYENFVMTAPGVGGEVFSTRFRNLLTVDPAVAYDAAGARENYTVTYSLHTRIANEGPGFVNACFENRFGDAGTLTATRLAPSATGTPRTRVTFFKQVMFREPALTLATYNLYALASHVRSVELEKLVCCSSIPAGQRCR